MRPGVKGTFTSTPASFAAFCQRSVLDRTEPPCTIRSGSETFLPPVAEAMKPFSPLLRKSVRSDGLIGRMMALLNKGLVYACVKTGDAAQSPPPSVREGAIRLKVGKTALYEAIR
jgi:hypothetical protein